MSDTIEPLDLNALKALSDAAAPGPWSADETGTVCADVDLEPDGAGGEILPEGGPAEVAECYRNERTGERAANAAFIAAARMALPQALAEIERLRGMHADAIDGSLSQGWERVAAEMERDAAQAEVQKLRAERVFAERTPGGSVPDGGDR